MDLVAYGGAALGIILAVSQFYAGHVGFAGCLSILLLSADFFLPKMCIRDRDIAGDEFMLGEMDLLGCYDMHNLEMLSRRAAELENTVISTIESNGVKLRRYENIEAFLSAEN